MCVSISSLSSNCRPLSNPFLIFCFPVNFKIELNCKLEFDPLLFLALKEEVWDHFGSSSSFCSLLEGGSEEGLCNFHLFFPLTKAFSGFNVCHYGQILWPSS